MAALAFLEAVFGIQHAGGPARDPPHDSPTRMIGAVARSALLAGWLGERQATSRVRLVRAQESLAAQMQRRGYGE
ncbi:MAG: hypothetical protein Kow00120_27490 [Anaerolineae bacterium]